MSTAAILVTLLVGQIDPFTDKARRADQLSSGSREQKLQAVRLFEEIHAEAVRRSNIDWELLGQWKAACCEYNLGFLPQAQERLKQAIKQAPEGHGLLVFMNRDLGEWYIRAWRPKDARPYVDEAIRLADNPPMVAGKPISLAPHVVVRIQILDIECRMLVGKHSSTRDRIGEQIKTIHEAIERHPGYKVELKQWLAFCNMHLAELNRREHKTLDAMKSLQKALDILDGDTTSFGVEVRFVCRLNFALNYRHLARFADAHEQYRLARKEAEQLGKDICFADVESNVAVLHFDEALTTLENGKSGANLPEGFAAAEKAIRKSFEYYEPMGIKRTIFHAAGYAHLAQIYYERGIHFKKNGQLKLARQQWQEALKHSNEAIDIYGALLPPDHDTVVHRRRDRAWIQLELEELDAARDEAQKIDELFVKNTDRVFSPVDRGSFLHLLMESEARLGNMKKASEYAEQNRQLAAKHLTPYLTAVTTVEQRKFLQRTDNPALHSCLRLGIQHESHREQALEWLLNGKARNVEVLQNVLKSAREDAATWKQYKECTERQASLLYGTPRDKNEFEAAFLSEEAKRRNLALKLTTNNSDSWYRVEDLRKRLAPDEVFVNIARVSPEAHAPAAYYAWVLTAKDPVHVIHLGDADRIDGLVVRFADHQKNFLAGKKLFLKLGPIEAEEVLQRDCLAPLSRSILDPILPLSKGKTKWIVSPDSSLWNVPWGALLLPDSKSYAIEKLTFRYVFSGRELFATSPDVLTAVDDGWILADPDVDHQPGPGWMKRTRAFPRLLGARMEGKEVSELLKEKLKVEPHTLPDQTVRDTLLAKGKVPKVFWLAAHGFFSEQHDNEIEPLLRCGIALSGYNYVPSEKLPEMTSLPGLMTGADILGLELQGTELVVLSACQSGIGELVPGQSPLDIRQAFHLAGARSVVSSLWSVDDLSTRALMRSFLDAFSGKTGGSYAEALRVAQVRMVEDLIRRKDHSHPFFWAAFTVSGH